MHSSAFGNMHRLLDFNRWIHTLTVYTPFVSSPILDIRTKDIRMPGTFRLILFSIFLVFHLIFSTISYAVSHLSLVVLSILVNVGKDSGAFLTMSQPDPVPNRKLRLALFGLRR